jgi:hypothetical protein
VTWIAAGAFDAQIGPLFEATASRLQLLAVTQQAMDMARLRIGDRVRVRDVLYDEHTPFWLSGVTGTYVRREGSQIVVCLDQPVDGNNRHIVCSPMLVDILPPS